METYRLSLLILLMGNMVSYLLWREAKTVIEEVDRWLAKGVIVEDTVALLGVIHTLDNPLGRMFAREELIKLYYLVGRNIDDYHHNFSDATDFYIEADRSKNKDQILSGIRENY